MNPLGTMYLINSFGAFTCVRARFSLGLNPKPFDAFTCVRARFSLVCDWDVHVRGLVGRE